MLAENYNRGVFIPNAAIFILERNSIGADFDHVQGNHFWAMSARQAINTENNAITCNFRQSSSKHLITLEPVKLTVSRLLKIVIKNLVCERLAWVLAHGARKKRKLLARKKNLLVRDDRTGVFSSPDHVDFNCQMHTLPSKPTPL